MRLLTLTLATLALIAPIASASAAPPVRAGVLQCQGGQNVGFVVGSVTSLECVFRSEGRRPEPYIAKVQRIGLDLGVTAQTQLSWAVNAPNSRLGRGELAGSYGGVGANASIGVGGGGNFLVGGPANAYALQPLSVQGQTGLNVAAGIAGLELQPVEFGPRRHHASPASPSRLTDDVITGKGPRSGPFLRFAGARHAPGKFWHGSGHCGIESGAPRARRAFFVSLLASHFSAGDYFMRRSLILAGAALAALASSIGGANAQQVQRVQVGVLECRGGASVGFIVGSVTNLGCVLRADGMPEDRYIATIRKVGLDLGITQESALAWGVFAPVARLGPGDLSGNYVGAQGSATLGVGVGGNVLVGGSANSIALQPLSVQGQVGVSIAAGLESLELRPGR